MYMHVIHSDCGLRYFTVRNVCYLHHHLIIDSSNNNNNNAMNNEV